MSSHNILDSLTPLNDTTMNPLSLGAIYRRDVLSLLPRPDIEQWRLVSRLSNSTIEVMQEGRLPRHRLMEFSLHSVSA